MVTPPDPKEEIVLAGFQVFTRNLFKHVTLQEVADEAGRKLSDVQKYYKTKEDLYRAVFDQVMSGIRRDTMPIYLEWKAKGDVSKKDARDALYRHIDLFMSATSSTMPERQMGMRIFITEILHPSPLYDEFYHKYFIENYSMLADIVMAATGSKDFDKAVYQLVAILGMVLSFLLEREFLVRFLSVDGFNKDETDYLKKLVLRNAKLILGITPLAG